MADLTTEEVDRLCEALNAESLELQSHAWRRVDGGQDCCISAQLADDAAATIRALQAALAAAEAERDAAVLAERDFLDRYRQHVVCHEGVDFLSPGFESVVLDEAGMAAIRDRAKAALEAALTGPFTTPSVLGGVLSTRKAEDIFG